ncbi:histone acetyltransferase complex subunit Eaf7 [Schizosaccharomyces japonicus yFS275]|uniref:Histone acetyltransferase complex subunit Eaf7 n=1 Tax=Schizosaccharomyces japonicus (strain yFS275 / FY16936) TaxID=402676 RepID=B6K7S7_SCHJY|nr:histone acetyltransferase complex subunit Eaf7 [Schizosaccharomyces japonicus yFS275]EEB09581.1 histone acetyltransferase complex subunit Eaf7 [Schizosaccharomyces japonicus yFS275]
MAETEEKKDETPETGLSHSSTTSAWTVEEETALLRAICMGLRPVGVHRHFHMLNILRQLNAKSQHKRVQDVWSKLESLYNLKGFEEIELSAEENSMFAPKPDATEKLREFRLPYRFLHKERKKGPASGGDEKKPAEEKQPPRKQPARKKPKTQPTRRSSRRSGLRTRT